MTTTTEQRKPIQPDEPNMLTEHNMKCPDCGNVDSFRIEIPQIILMTGEGAIDSCGNAEFDSDNNAQCGNEDCPKYSDWNTVGYFQAAHQATT